jgi:aspartyl-tRNA(Asn)/glutamyl-tRNA(Gln) amidotransferase subunit A
MINKKELTIETAYAKLVSKEITVRELVDAYVAEAQARNPEINAYVELFSDLDPQIEIAQKMIDDGTSTLLTGIPTAIKDNMVYQNHISACGSKMLETYVGAYDSTIVADLKKQGAIIIGRTNMDEFAMGSSTETSYYGITKNPYDATRVPGGSSGGPASAMAMDGALLSLASDTGGSIRQPASYCNLVGLKPTYGTISRYGLVALASSLDQIGPMTKTVTDSEIAFNLLSAHDVNDSTSVPVQIREENKKVLKKKIGVPYHFFEGGGVQTEILEKFKETIENLKNDGYEIVPITLDYIHYSLPTYYIIQPAEASSNLARFDGIRYGYSEEHPSLIDVYNKTRGNGFGKEVRRRILLGTYVLSHGYYDAYYGKALLMKEQIKKELNKIYEDVDVIATPTTAKTAFKFGEKSGDPVSMYLEDIFVVPANITGDPSISIPIGFDSNKLPFGMQLIAPAFNEHLLFAIGKDIENNLK